MTDESKHIHYAWLFAIGAIWRAWFGGSFKHIARGVKYVVLAAVVLLMYWTKGLLDWCSWRMYATIGSFMYFWAMGHGAYFKYWDTTDDAEDRHPWMTKLVAKICGSLENSRTFWGNFVGMFIRYTFTAIFVALAVPSYWFLSAGLLVAICYIPAGIAHNTKIGEVLAGGLCFCLLWSIL